MTVSDKTHLIIDRKLCKACGICIGMCPKKVFTVGKDGKPVDERIDLCVACGICELMCPDFAIRLEGKK